MSGYILLAAAFGFFNWGYNFGVTSNSGSSAPTEYNYYIPSGSDHYAVAGGDLYQVVTH